MSFVKLFRRYLMEAQISLAQSSDCAPDDVAEYTFYREHCSDCGHIVYLFVGPRDIHKYKDRCNWICPKCLGMVPEPRMCVFDPQCGPKFDSDHEKRQLGRDSGV